MTSILGVYKIPKDKCLYFVVSKSDKKEKIEYFQSFLEKSEENEKWNFSIMFEDDFLLLIKNLNSNKKISSSRPQQLELLSINILKTEESSFQRFCYSKLIGNVEEEDILEVFI